MSSNGCAVVTQNNETHITAKTYIFTWVVKNFNFNLPLYYEEDITSAPFRTEYGEFEMKLYPSGIYERLKGFVSLKIVKKTEEIIQNTRSVISLVDETGDEDFHYSEFLRETEDMKLIEKFVERCDITSDFLPNGHLTIKWRLYFYIGSESFENAPMQREEYLAEKRRLAEFDDFGILLNDSRFSDIKISVGTQKYFAHKNILAARSGYFAAIFEPNTKEADETEIRVSEYMSTNIMQEILRFIYTGKINVEKTKMTDLLIAANRFKLEGLITICEEAIISNMSLENIGNILSVTDCLSNAAILKDAAIEFLTMNAKVLSGNESFRKVLNSLSTPFMAEVINIMMAKM